MRKVTFLMLLAFGALLLSGCGDRSREVLVRINDKVMTLDEFNERIERLPKYYQEMIRGQKKKFLDEIIKEELLYREALKSGIDKDEETQEVIAEAKKKILVSRLIKNRVDDRMSVSEEELRKYYDEHSEEFMLPERWRAAHILVDTAEKAEQIKEKLDRGGAFKELAMNMSEDASSAKGGDVGYFSKGQLIPDFENACFELEVGEVSDIVKTQFGYHIIKLTDKKSPEVQEFESVKKIIEKEQVREKRKRLIDELITDLRSNAKITINERLLEDTEGTAVEPITDEEE